MAVTCGNCREPFIPETSELSPVLPRYRPQCDRCYFAGKWPVKIKGETVAEETIAGLKDELRNVRNLLDAAGRAKREALDLVDRYRIAGEHLESEKDRADNKVGALVAELRRIDELLEKANAERSELRLYNAALESANEDLTKSLRSTRELYQAAVSDLCRSAETNNKAGRRIAQLEKLSEGSIRDRARLEKEAHALRKRCDELGNAIKGILAAQRDADVKVRGAWAAFGNGPPLTAEPPVVRAFDPSAEYAEQLRNAATHVSGRCCTTVEPERDASGHAVAERAKPLHVQVAEVDGWTACSFDVHSYGMLPSRWTGKPPQGDHRDVPGITHEWAWNVAVLNGLCVQELGRKWHASGPRGVWSNPQATPEEAVASWYVEAFKRDGKRARS